MSISGIVVTCVHCEFVSLGNCGVLFEELAVDILLCVVEGTVVDVEADTKCKHILTLNNALVIQTGFSQRLFGHRGNVGNNYIVILQAKLLDGVESCKTGLLNRFLGQRVAVDNYGSTGFQPFSISFKSCGVHCNEHVAIVAGVGYVTATEMKLEARNTCYGALRCADFGGVVGECRDSVTHQCRGVGEECSGELHTVARVARETDNNVLQLLNILFVHK